VNLAGGTFQASIPEQSLSTTSFTGFGVLKSGRSTGRLPPRRSSRARGFGRDLTVPAGSSCN
jgi:hypothetical protein